MDLQTLYIICAAAGGTVVVLRLILMMLGIGGDIDADAPVDLDHGGDFGDHDAGGGYFQFFSIQSIAGFFTMFGLVGWGLLQVNASELISLLGGLGAGVVTAWVTGMIFIGMQRLQSEGTLVIGNAVGQEGTVYLSIPEKGSGEVTVPVQGSMRTMNAVSKDGKRLPTGTIIKVVGITAGNILVVEEK
jgi:hypothetical protein